MADVDAAKRPIELVRAAQGISGAGASRASASGEGRQSRVKLETPSTSQGRMEDGWMDGWMDG